MVLNLTTHVFLKSTIFPKFVITTKSAYGKLLDSNVSGIVTNTNYCFTFIKQFPNGVLDNRVIINSLS